MKKIKYAVASLLASGLLLAGCGKQPEACNHNDADNNHLCDNCNEKLTECADGTNDHLCDICGEKLSECADANNDHLCDVCGEPVTQHTDGNNDHNCDICGEKISEHADSNGDHKCDLCDADLPYVASVTVTGAPDTLAYGKTATLTVAVDAQNGASEEVEWTTSNENVDLTDNGDGTITVTALHGGEVTITATAADDESATAQVTLTVLDWTDEELEIMEEYLGERMPYFAGDYEWTDYYFEEYGCITAETMTTGTEAATAAAFQEAGWSVTKNGKQYVIEYASEINAGVVLNGQIYTSYGITSVDVYPSLFELDAWPAEAIAETLAFEAEVPEVVPAVEGDLFSFGVEEPGVCYVKVYKAGGVDLISYINDLIGKGWLISTSYYNVYGFYLLQSPRASIQLQVYPSSSVVYIINIGEPTPVYTSWPTDIVAGLCNGLTEETIPAATTGTLYSVNDYKEKFIAGDSFYFAEIIVEGGNLEEYLAALTSAGFEYFFDDVYECYTATKGNLILDVYVNDGSIEISAYLGEVEEEGFSWETFASSFVVQCQHPTMGKLKYRFTFDGNGGVIGQFAGTTGTPTFTVTADFAGCGENQIHLTGDDDDWNGLGIDIIVESTDGENFTVVSDKSVDLWGW